MWSAQDMEYSISYIKKTKTYFLKNGLKIEFIRD